MVIDNSNVVSVTVVPSKDHAPLIVYANGIKASQISLQLFQSI